MCLFIWNPNEYARASATRYSAHERSGIAVYSDPWAPQLGSMPRSPCAGFGRVLRLIARTVHLNKSLRAR
jgi:hypothetical protein